MLSCYELCDLLRSVSVRVRRKNLRASVRKTLAKYTRVCTLVLVPFCSREDVKPLLAQQSHCPRCCGKPLPTFAAARDAAAFLSGPLPFWHNPAQLARRRARVRVAAHLTASGPKKK